MFIEDRWFMLEIEEPAKPKAMYISPMCAIEVVFIQIKAMHVCITEVNKRKLKKIV